MLTVLHKFYLKRMLFTLFLHLEKQCYQIFTINIRVERNLKFNIQKQATQKMENN